MRAALDPAPAQRLGFGHFAGPCASESLKTRTKSTAGIRLSEDAAVVCSMENIGEQRIAWVETGGRLLNTFESTHDARASALFRYTISRSQVFLMPRANISPPTDNSASRIVQSARGHKSTADLELSEVC